MLRRLTLRGSVYICKIMHRYAAGREELSVVSEVPGVLVGWLVEIWATKRSAIDLFAFHQNISFLTRLLMRLVVLLLNCRSTN